MCHNCHNSLRILSLLTFLLICDNNSFSQNVEALYQLGVSYAAKNQYAQMDSALEQCLKISTKYEKKIEDFYSQLVNKAKTLFKSKEWEPAIKLCEHISQTDSLYTDKQIAETLYTLGRCYFHTNQFAEMRVPYTKIWRLPDKYTDKYGYDMKDYLEKAEDACANLVLENLKVDSLRKAIDSYQLLSELDTDSDVLKEIGFLMPKLFMQLMEAGRGNEERACVKKAIMKILELRTEGILNVTKTISSDGASMVNYMGVYLGQVLFRLVNNSYIEIPEGFTGKITISPRNGYCFCEGI
jgi:tetratricopeptide (TPR) repeat protein